MKIIDKLRLIWHSLLFGMKSADELLTTNNKQEDGSSSITQEMGGKGVYNDLLDEKVTKEVEELRYKSYKVFNESKKYRYVGNGNVKKKSENQLKENHVKVDETDGLEPDIIQDNKIITKGVLDVLDEVEVSTKEKKYDGEQYNLSIVRDYLSRFKLEEYVTKIVVKRIEDNESIVDLYCSKYPRQFSKKDNSFIRELIDVMNTGRKKDFLDFKEMKFISSEAFGSDNFIEYQFDCVKFLDIREFDGNFVIKFKCHNKNNVYGINLIENIYSEETEEKYKNKDRKENSVISLESVIQNEKENNEYNISSNIDLNKLKNVKLKID